MTITRIRRTADDVDDYGNPVLGTEDRTELEGAFTAPRVSEGINGRERAGVMIGLTLFLPYGTDLVYTDLVEIDGDVWVLDGEPASWKNGLTKREAGMTAELTRGEG